MTRRQSLSIGAVAILFGVGVAGWIGALIGAAGVLIGRANWTQLIGRSAAGASILLVIAAVDTITGPTFVSRTFADDRDLAHAAASLAAILIFVAVLAACGSDRAASQRES